MHRRMDTRIPGWIEGGPSDRHSHHTHTSALRRIFIADVQHGFWLLLGRRRGMPVLPIEPRL